MKITNTIRNSICLAVILSIFFIQNISQADCKMTNYNAGWTGSIEFNCDDTVDIKQNPITFNISDGEISGPPWGFPGFDTKVTQTGQLVTINVQSEYNPGGAVLKPGTYKFSFSPSQDKYTITDFHVGPVKPEKFATVNLVQADGSDPIPPTTAINLTSSNTSSNTTYSFKWSDSHTQKIDPGSYNVSVTTSSRVSVVNADGSQPNITVDPIKFTAQDQQQQTITVNNKKFDGSVLFKVSGSKPKNVQQDTVTVHTLNQATQERDTVNVKWDGKETPTAWKNIKPNNTYSFTADVITTSTIGDYYSFEIQPSTVDISAEGSYNVTLVPSEVSKDLKNLDINVSGLPDKVTTTLFLNPADEFSPKTTIPDVGNRPIKNKSFAYGNYHVTANNITVAGKTYTMQPFDLAVDKDSPPNDTLSLTFTESGGTLEISPYVDVGLWEVYQGGTLSGLKTDIQNSGAQSVRLAFIVSNDGTCTPRWAAYKEDISMGSQIVKELISSGIKIYISFGGAYAGTGASGQSDLSFSCQGDAALAEVYKNVITQFSPNGLDFDIEGTVYNIDNMMKAIATVKKQYPNLKISFTLAVTPDGIPEGALGTDILKAAKDAGLRNFSLNVMAMDYSGKFDPTGPAGTYAVQSAQAAYKQFCSIIENCTPSQMQVTPMIGINDSYPLNFDLTTDVKTLVNYAKSNGLTLLSYWSFTRDHPCSMIPKQINCSSLNPKTGQPNQSSDYAYLKAFTEN